ncbi:MAG: hypothetical protein HYV07_07685 [Deltaproteobacteria bacterium]|nr:hypothetical protein [Deltaproteobacteria bacterium]
MNVKYIIRAAIMVIGLLSSACGPRISTWTQYRHELALKTKQSQQEGVTVDVRAISDKDVASDARYHRSFGWNTANRFNGQVEKGGETDWPVIPVPSWEVKIANGTGHVLRLTGAVIKMIDGAGNVIDTISKDELAAQKADELEAGQKNWAEVLGAKGINFAGFDADAGKKLQDAIKRLKLLSQNAEVLPNMTETYIAAFRLPVEGGLDEQTKWLGEQTVLTLKIFEVVTETDAAGTPTKRVAFEFPLEVRTYLDTIQSTNGVQKTLSSKEVSK